MAEFDASIRAHFGGDVSGLQSAVTKANSLVGSFKDTLGKIGLTLGMGAVTGFFATVINKASEVDDLSKSLGMGSDQMQAFAYSVRLAGGDAQSAAQLLRKVRQAVDELAGGSETAATTFQKLGLSAKDLVGIPLEEALSKIASAYVATNGQAGAYSALVDIIGSKSTRLMSVLEELGRSGFGAMEQSARKAGQVIDSETIQRLDEIGDKAEMLKGTLITGGSKILSYAFQFGDGLGIMAAKVVNTFDGIASNFDGVIDDVNQKAQEAARVVEKTETMSRGRLATEKELATYREAEFRREVDRLELQGRKRDALNVILNQANEYMRQAANLEQGTAERLELTNKAKDLFLQYERQNAALQKESAASSEAQLGTQKGQLAVAGSHAKTLAGDLKTGEVQRLQLLTDQEASLRRQLESAEGIARASAGGNELLKEGNGFLTVRYSGSVQQREIYEQQALKLREQIGQNESLHVAEVLRAGTESEMTIELAKQTSELRTQLALIESRLQSFEGAGSPLGMHDMGNVATDVLTAKRTQLEKQMRDIELQYRQNGWTGNARQDNYYLASQIDSITQELEFRTKFQQAYARGGRSGALTAFAQSGDALSFDRALSNMSSWASGPSTAVETNKVLAAISQQLAGSGFFPPANPIR